MSFPPLEPPRILLHVIIPGQPHAQQRHRWSRGRIYDPSSEDKEAFQWQLKAACPTLKPELHARLGIRLIVWTAKHSTQEDNDNFLKFYQDALSPPKSKHKRKKGESIDLSKYFAAWGNDNQVDESYVRVRRGAANPKVEILVYEIPAGE